MSSEAAESMPDVGRDGTIENAIGALGSMIDQNHNTASELHEALGLTMVADDAKEAARPSPVTTVEILLNQLDELHRSSRYLNERLNQALGEARRLRNA